MKTDKHSIQFFDQFDYHYHQESTTIQLAKDVKPFFKEHQMARYEKFLFASCPGMYDYSKSGYIIPSWHDFHIKANKAGIIVHLGMPAGGIKHQQLNPQKMNINVVDGIFENKLKFIDVTKCPAPWYIRTSPNVSAYVMPAFYHSPFLDDLYVYPGIVDYDKFNVINFIFSPKRECEIIIKAGTPLLQVIPFLRAEFQGEVKIGNLREIGNIKSNFFSSVKSFYRRALRSDKVFKLIKK